LHPAANKASSSRKKIRFIKSRITGFRLRDLY
jgi:hypothetical protein